MSDQDHAIGLQSAAARNRYDRGFQAPVICARQHDLERVRARRPLPQLPLTLGNAVIAITEEDNRLFPDRPVTERKAAVSTGLMNLIGPCVGAIPMCQPLPSRSSAQTPMPAGRPPNL